MTGSRTLPRRRTLLLIGGAGFIGTNLADRLEADGHDVLVTGRRRPGSGMQVGAGRLVLTHPLEAIEELKALVRDRGVDMVIHLASGLLPSSGEAAYVEEHRRVFEPTVRLARSLADMGVGLTFLSSGGTVYGVPRSDLAAEDDPCAPISLYGQAKLELELHLRFLARTAGLRCLIVRPSNPYGPHQRLDGQQGLVSVMLGRLAAGRPLDVWGDGSVIRDFIHIDDATESIAGLVGRDAQGVVNVGSGVGHSVLDVARAVSLAVGRSVPIVFHSARPADVPRLVLDIGRLDAMGLHRARPLEDGIADYARRLGMAA